MGNEINKIDALWLTLERNGRLRAEYNTILMNMDAVIKENVYVFFKMFIQNRNVGYLEVKHNERSYEIPHQLNEQIYHLVHNYYSREIRELEEERDKIMERWLKNNNFVKENKDESK